MNGQTSIDHWLADPHAELDSFIYHYTNEEGALRIVESGRFRLSSYERMNDPREAKEWVAEQLEFPPGSESLHQEVDRLLRRSARIGSFTADSLPTDGSAPGSLFHRGWGRAAVWDRYAYKHQGACLVFDMAALSQYTHESMPPRNGNVMGGGRVKYIDAPVTIPVTGRFSSLDELREELDDMTTRRGVIGDLYLTKNKDWESEREFRLVAILWDLAHTELDTRLEVPYGDALKAIIVGDAHPDPAALLGALEKRPGAGRVDLLRCSWWGGAPVLSSV